MDKGERVGSDELLVSWTLFYGTAAYGLAS